MFRQIHGVCSLYSTLITSSFIFHFLVGLTVTVYTRHTWTFPRSRGGWTSTLIFYVLQDQLWQDSEPIIGMFQYGEDGQTLGILTQNMLNIRISTCMYYPWVLTIVMKINVRPPHNENIRIHRVWEWVCQNPKGCSSCSLPQCHNDWYFNEY